MKFGLHVLENDTFRVETTNVGAGIHAIYIKQQNVLRRVTAHPPDLSSYVHNNHAYFGSTCGRTVNRIRNAEYEFEGKNIRLSKNENEHHLHGGLCGFSHHKWLVKKSSVEHITYHLLSSDKDQGYPGNVQAEVTYRLSPDSIHLEYFAITDKVTPVNFTNHTYFNLNADINDNVLSHTLLVNATEALETDHENLFTGKSISLRDFMPSVAEGVVFRELVTPFPRGLDHCFVLQKHENGIPALQAELSVADITLRVYGTQPCLQVYSGYYLDQHSYAGYRPKKFSGIALESCGYPDAVNIHSFPGAFLMPGQEYRHKTIWEFELY